MRPVHQLKVLISEKNKDSFVQHSVPLGVCAVFSVIRRKKLRKPDFRSLYDCIYGGTAIRGSDAAGQGHCSWNPDQSVLGQKPCRWCRK